MAKKKKAAKEKETQPLPEGQKPKQEIQRLQVWGLQETQKAVLKQSQNRYNSELKVITNYQEDNWKRMLAEIAQEIGIPKGINVRFDGKTMTFTEVPPEPHVSPTTQDLTKIPV